MEQRKLHFIFIFMLMSCVQSITSQETRQNSTIEVPLLDNQRMPLVVLFDTTQLNQVLKDYIIKTVEETTDQKIPIIKKTVIEDIGYEPGRKQERPAFSASLTSSITLQSNEVLKFDKVWLNMGNVYDPTTGVFTVSRNGLYFVSSTVMANRGQYLHCHLWKNNQSDVGIFGTNYSTGTLNTVMALKKGDRIYAKHDDNKAGEQMYGNHWSMFSAYLISEQ
ncbi:C1q-related factor-like isoform X1 [Mytilus californianus]|uniref:C1q-related factor-like isoform X1 n=1 Tax=Mytilus californianus TaxID=6549 RepID=UPI0022458647|nr:C1q-related factor-like isoform X1 [Mytilus californianus]